MKKYLFLIFICFLFVANASFADIVIDENDAKLFQDNGYSYDDIGITDEEIQNKVNKKIRKPKSKTFDVASAKIDENLTAKYRASSAVIVDDVTVVVGVVLKQTEADLLNLNGMSLEQAKNYTVEFDFAPKWAESIGQSLYYGKMTGKKPAVILIIEKPADWKYYHRLNKIAADYNITVWYMKSPEYDAKEKPKSNNDDNIKTVYNYLKKLLKDYLL